MNSFEKAKFWLPTDNCNYRFRLLIWLLVGIGLWSIVLMNFSHQLAQAQESSSENSRNNLPINKLGIHILSTGELEIANDLFSVTDNNDTWHYVTVPLTINDLQKEHEWLEFFQQAQEQKIIPIVRLASRFENQVWIKPTRKDVVEQITFLSKMPWAGDRRYLIIGNEVNHAPEWGGELDPAGYTNYLVFASQWARAVDPKFFILPAALDLDAPNSSTTREAIGYLRNMVEHDPDLFSYLDGWNSHSYPNPAFSAPPTATGKNSLRGYQTELAVIAEHTDKNLPVFITETGWRQTAQNQRKLLGYYDYALKHVWNDPRIMAVTPFVLQGAPGQFAAFSFLDAGQKPTAQYVAFQTALKKVLTTVSLSGVMVADPHF